MIRILLIFFTMILPAAGQTYAEGTSLTEMAPGTIAPDFTLSDTDGNKYTLSDYRGKVVIVNFWTTWCPPCREEMPAMQRSWEIIQNENMVMLGINLGEDEDTIFEFTASYPVDFPLLMDLDSSVTSDWPVMGLPTTYIVDPEGNIAYRAIGGRAWDAPEILDRMRALFSLKE
jgi:peroxiredoxin